jgi:hypothetical protein
VGTGSYAEAPNGLQANGIFLSTGVFGSGSQPFSGTGSPTLGSDTFNGTTFDRVNHMVTTSILGAGINNPCDPNPPGQGGCPAAAVPESSTFFLLGTGLIGLIGYARKNKAA